MADLRATQKIEPTLHERMKEIVKMKGGEATLFKEYEIAIRNHIQKFQEENVLADSNLEHILEGKINKVDKHLASMLGRTGMDVSMLLIGMVYLLQKEFSKGDNKIDEATILEKLRVEGARYYTGANQKRD